MKKVISLLICLTIISQCFITVMAAETTETAVPVAYSDEISFLQSFKIMEADRDYPENQVTRQDFALYIGRMLKIDELAATNVRYFYDVDVDGYNASIINALVEAEIISQSEDKMYRPHDRITKAEALKMVLCALGYGDYCEVKGGFPLGYIRTASELDIGIGNELLTVSDAAKVIYDAMKAPMYMVTGYDDEYKIGASDPSKTVLTVYWGMDVAEGNLVASYLGACQDQVIDTERRVRVSDKWYDLADGVDADGYLASYVRVFYDRITEEVAIIQEINETESIKLDVEQFMSFNKDKIEYYNESGEKRSIRLDDAYIIYNGMPLETEVSSTLENLKKGNITIKDANDDGSYDVVLIDDYSTYVVSAVDVNFEKIYNELGTSDSVSMEDFGSAKIQTSSGIEVEFSDIAKGNVLSVAMSKNKEVIRIIIEDNIAEGVLTQLKTAESKYKVCIDDVWYEVDKEYGSDKAVIFEHGITTGSRYTYVIDSFGKLAYLEIAGESRGKLGYIIALNEEGLFANKVLVKMLTEDSEVCVFTFAEKIIIDGKQLNNFSMQNVMNEISDTADASGHIGQMVRYVVENEEIKEIDTRQYTYLEDESDTLTATFNETSSQKWFLNNRFMIKGIIDGATSAFCVPFDPSSAKDEEYCVLANAQVVANNCYYYADTYRMHRSPGIAQAVLVRYKEDGIYKNYNLNQKSFLVEEIATGIDEEGNNVTIISGYENGAKKEYMVPVENVSLEALEEGDLVKFSYDMYGNPTKTEAAPNGYTLLYDKSVGGLPDRKVWTGMGSTEAADTGRTLYDGSGTANTAYYNVPFQLSFGYASDADEGIVGWSWREKTNDPEKISEYVNCSSIPVIIIEDNGRDVNIYRGKVDDIDTYEKAGDNCSRVICHAYSNNIRALYVYK